MTSTAKPRSHDQDRVARSEARRLSEGVLTCVRVGDVAGLTALLDKGASLGTVEEGTGASLVHLAVLGGHEEVLEALLKAGASPRQEMHHATERRGEAGFAVTPLWLATRHARPRLARMLLDHGALPESPAGAPPMLLVAAKGGKPALVQMLLQGGASPKTAQANGKTALHWAAQLGHGEVATVLMQAKCPVDARVSGSGETALYLAASNDHPSLVAALLQRGADPQLPCLSDGSTPLFVAARDGRKEIALELLRAGADVNATDNDGYTPADIATVNGHQDIVDRLLAARGKRPKTGQNRQPNGGAMKRFMRAAARKQHSSSSSSNDVSSSSSSSTSLDKISEESPRSSKQCTSYSTALLLSSLVLLLLGAAAWFCC